MLTKIMKWGSIAALLVLATAWPAADKRTFVAALVVWAGAFVVLVQATQAHKYAWAAVFLAVCLLFNPVVPVSVSRISFLLLDLACLGMFVASLSMLTKPRLSIASITDRTPGSESL
jgi:hypothetical protein